MIGLLCVWVLKGSNSVSDAMCDNWHSVLVSDHFIRIAIAIETWGNESQENMDGENASDFPFYIISRGCYYCCSGWRPCINLVKSERSDIV